MPGPTLKTVAAAAGVSVATASNAYNRPDKMSSGVRARILAAAEDLGYPGPDPAARSLRRGHSGSIGILFSTQLSYAFADPYCIELLAGVSSVAEQNGATLSLLPLPPVGTDRTTLQQAVSAVRSAVVDGVIADGMDTDHPAIRLLRAREIPIVQSVDRSDARRVVAIDDFGAARTVGEHLARQGHQRAAFLLDAPDTTDSSLFPYARLRLAGFRAGFGGTVTPIAAGGNTYDHGQAAAAAVIGGEITALVAVSDVLALGALRAVRRSSLRPGRDLAVTGFDDVPAAARAGLTTVRQPIREKGRLMARMLLDTDFSEERVLLPAELVIRASSRAIRS